MNEKNQRPYLLAAMLFFAVALAQAQQPGKIPTIGFMRGWITY